MALDKILNSKVAERTRRFLGKHSGIYFKLKRFTASSSEELRTVKLLHAQGIDCVLDVGANTGQFAESLYDFGYTGRVISFEPVAAVHAALRKRAAKYPNWVVAERCAIGDQDGETTIHVSDATVFSSLLKIKDKHAQSVKKARIIAEEKVPLHRLDSIVGKYLPEKATTTLLLKIDTQGFEKQVLAGAVNTLAGARGLKIEIPLSPIYEDVQFTFFQVIDFVRDNGFTPYSFSNEGVNLDTGRLNTMDGIFFREASQG